MLHAVPSATFLRYVARVAIFGFSSIAMHLPGTGAQGTVRSIALTG